MMSNDIVYGLSEISLYLSNIGRDDYAQTIEDACKKLDLLKEQPGIVLCKDCKYYDHFNGCMSWHDVNSNNDNWYCADGKRR